MDAERKGNLQQSVHSSLPPARRQTFPLIWVLSIAGLIMTCATILGASIGLYTWLSEKSAGIQNPPTLDVSFYLAQTEIASRQAALALTSTAMVAPSPSLQPGTGNAPQPTLTSQPNQTSLALPTPTGTPAAAQPAAAGEPAVPQPLTGSQVLEDKRLFDDFSSGALGWPVFDDGLTILKYENGAYRFQITQPDYYDWAFMPVEFIPYEMEFDVQGSPGVQDGNFGVYCQFQDEQNYYYVEIDLQTNTYIIGEVVDGQNTPLTQPDTAGQYWRSAPTLQTSASSTNHIAVGCYLSDITLFINNENVDLVFVPQQFETPGKAAFFVSTMSFADQDGYSVLFDNVEVYQPVQ